MQIYLFIAGIISIIGYKINSTYIFKRKKNTAAFKKINDAFGNELFTNKLGLKLSGEINGRKIQVISHSGEGEGFEFGYEITIENPFLGKFSSDDVTIYIYSFDFSYRLLSILGIEDINTEDKVFDKKINIRSSNSFITIALMNSNIRKKLLKLNRNCELYFENNFFRIRTVSNGVVDTILVIKYIKTMLSICEEMTNFIPVKKRLIDNALNDEIPEVKLLNLKMLIDNFALDDNIISILKKNLKSNNIDLILHSADTLGKKGMPRIIHLLKTNKDLKFKKIHKIIEILKKNKYIKSIPVLKDYYNKTENDTLKKDILSSFKIFADESLNGFLMKELKKKDNSLELEIINTLGTCGKITSIERLHKLRKRSLDIFIRNAATKSINKIQSRLGNVDEGWLSLEELNENDGALSFNENDQNGRLSISGDKKIEESKTCSRFRYNQ